MRAHGQELDRVLVLSHPVRVQKTGKLKYDTDLLIDQVRAISNRRLMYCYCTLGANHLKKVEEALRLLTGQ